jgi:acetate kinase
MLSVRVLVVNAGSSSLKLRLIGGDDQLIGEHNVERWAGVPADGLAGVLREVGADADAVGHRVVHGGERTEPALVDRRLEGALHALVPLAPLHQPRALACMRLVADVLPDVPAVACFDTAFHRTMPEEASTYALPEAWRARWPLRRFGFHGLSHAYASRRAAELLGPDAAPDPRLVVCHLGAGASLCATRAGRSVDTTMGFTPMEGIVMATRSGSVDPGLLLWLLTDGGLTVEALAEGLRSHAGLAGLAGGSGDMREVLERRDAGDPLAELALDVYLHRLVAGVAAMAAALGGLDGLVFTGGVGEGAPTVRSAAAARLAFLGVRLDDAANAAPVGGDDVDVGLPGSPVRTFVIRAREDLEIARQVRAVTG